MRKNKRFAKFLSLVYKYCEGIETVNLERGLYFATVQISVEMAR